MSTGGGTTLRVDRLASTKSRAALALAVSLWIATGGVASAQETTISSGNFDYVYGNHANGNFRAVDDSAATSGNVVNMTDGVVERLYGAWTSKAGSSTSSNTVVISGGTIKEKVCGGYVVDGGEAINNIVTLNGVELTGVGIYGGGKGDGQEGDVVTGNTLNLSGANSAQSIANFATVNIKSAVWGTPALTLTGNIGTVNNINTSGIVFSNLDALKEVGENTILIQGGMTGYGGTITGTTYKVGSTLQGEGYAELDGANLKFVVGTKAENMTVQEQTHNTVMGAEVGMAALSAGNDFIGAATDGLSLASNVGADGVSSFAKMGGGTMRQETGSHVDTHTWNAILALGHQNKKERGTFEYGAFFEYGSGNYSTFNGDERGDGSMHYTGGGLLAKYTTKNNVYVEGSLRAGSVHDDARNVLRDVNGMPYSYETNAPYWGAHIGVGKIIDLGSDHELDVYGKFYHNHRKGVSFNAGGHYDLDAVNSDVLRIGARYTLKREKWNFYGGLAYEHELDGKASGTADGMKIRSADTSGASLRGELGVTFKPEKEGPLTLDFNVSGFAGKKRGVTGGVSVSLMF